MPFLLLHWSRRSGNCGWTNSKFPSQYFNEEFPRIHHVAGPMPGPGSSVRRLDLFLKPGRQTGDWTAVHPRREHRLPVLLWMLTDLAKWTTASCVNSVSLLDIPELQVLPLSGPCQQSSRGQQISVYAPGRFRFLKAYTLVFQVHWKHFRGVLNRPFYSRDLAV